MKYLVLALSLLSTPAWASCVPGSLSGTVTTYTASQSVNLTTLAASSISDWAAFGYTASASSIARKSTGGSAISALSQVGAATLTNYDNTGTQAWLSSWSDGASPNGTGSSEGYLVYSSASAVGNGMSFTVPADTTSRTLLVYVVVFDPSTYLAEGQLTATLSDASAGTYTDTSVNTTTPGNLLGVYTITYNASSASQHLAISWTNNTTNSQNVQLYAVVIE